MLSEFRCELKCPYAGALHPISVRTEGTQFNAAEIPQVLAEEVADYVNATFYAKRIRYTKHIDLTPEEEGEFDTIMKAAT